MTAVVTCVWCRFAMSMCAEADSHTGKGAYCAYCGATNGLHVEPYKSADVVEIAKERTRKPVSKDKVKAASMRNWIGFGLEGIGS
jgi:hypothetical protein